MDNQPSTASALPTSKTTTTILRSILRTRMPTAPPDLPGASANDSPLDRALALMLADEREAALRWSAAVVEQEESVPSALILTCRLLADFGRTEAAIEGFRLGLERAIDAGNLPLAVAAIARSAQARRERRRAPRRRRRGVLLGLAAPHRDARRRRRRSRAFATFQPLSSFLTGPALLSKATQIVHDGEEQVRGARRREPTARSRRSRSSARSRRTGCARSSRRSR